MATSIDFVFDKSIHKISVAVLCLLILAVGCELDEGESLDEEIPRLVTELGYDSFGRPRIHPAAEAAERLIDIGEPAVPTLIEALTGEFTPAPHVNPQSSFQLYVDNISYMAVSVLAQIGQPAIPPLVELLTHDQIEVRLRAALALGRIGEPAHDAVPALIEALDDESDRVYNQVSETLQRIGTPEALAAVNGHKR